MRHKTIIYFLSFLFCSNAIGGTCSKNGTSIFYVNGVLASLDDHARSVEKMQKVIFTNGESAIDSKLEYNGTYFNQTQGKKDILEAFTQLLRARGYSADKAWQLGAAFYFGLNVASIKTKMGLLKIPATTEIQEIIKLMTGEMRNEVGVTNVS